MRIGSLFSGAGGLDMAVEAVFGGHTVWHSEIDKAASKVLAHRWPDVPNLGSITEIDWATVEPVDVLCLGFPCQDVSAAGKRAGIKDGTRSGLWAYAAGAIEALRASIVVVENVRGLLSAEAHRGVESDEGTMGNGASRPVLRAAGAVLGDLADLGYDARWATVSAASVGAPHRRERVFIVATDASGDGFSGRAERHLKSTTGIEASQRDDADRRVLAVGGDNGRRVDLLPTPRSSDCFGAGLHGDGGMDLRTTVTLLPTPAAGNFNDGEGAEQWFARREAIKQRKINGNGMGMPLTIAVQAGWGKYEPAIRRWESLTRLAPTPTQPNRNGNPRLSARFSEWLMGWPAGWVTDPAIGISRNDQLRIVGNGVCPQQAAAALRQLLAVTA